MSNTSGFNTQIPQSLRDLYQEALDKSLQKPLNPKDDSSSPTNPFIPNADARYWDADVKVMIFGKETRGWLIEKPDCKEVETIAEHYCTGMEKGVPKWGGTFRNGFKLIKDQIDDHYAPKGMSVGFAWNNVIKIGKQGKGTPSEDIIKWQDHWFDVTRQELVEYRPNIIVFLTGPGYDRFIKKAFSPVTCQSITGYKVNEMVTLHSVNFGKAKVIRTYHPYYMTRSKKLHYLTDLVNLLLDQ